MDFYWRARAVVLRPEKLFGALMLACHQSSLPLSCTELKYVIMQLLALATALVVALVMALAAALVAAGSRTL